MSPYPQQPLHFWDWLRDHGLAPGDDPEAFVPRQDYGTYLVSLIDDLLRREAATGRFTVLREECVSVKPGATGVEVRLANGVSIAARSVVLAVGHDPSPAPEHAFAVRIGSPQDTPLDADAQVLILGTGLSMIDAWLSLRDRGHRGRISIVSRRGLMPLPHSEPRVPLKLDMADIPLGTELSYFVRWVTGLIAEVKSKGGDWRDVVDGLRPFNQAIWKNWPKSARRRFMEHTKAWWDIHRHRVPAPLHAAFTAAIEADAVRLIAGRVVAVEPVAGGLRVSVQRRHEKRVETIDVARIYDCTGIAKDVSKGSIGVVRSLTDRGFARPDPLRLGLDVTADCAIVAADGTPSDRIYAIGPLTRGTFFEIEAVPDIRAQCVRLARRLAG